MNEENGHGLSARKVQYLKFIYEHGGQVKTGELATHFCVDVSTISKTINELTDRGLLSHAPYRKIALSRQGKECAEFFIKRHRILSLVLARYGLSQEQACNEVSRFESLVSREAIDTMCRAMGHPRMGICGEITHDKGCMTGQAGS
jgi:Mn-dependent DtxR family transcriptional regulator